MSYFLNKNHAPITPRVIVESIQSWYAEYADYDLSKYVEFGIAVLLMILGLNGLAFCLKKALEFLRVFFVGLGGNVRSLVYAIDNKKEQKSKNYFTYAVKIIGILFNAGGVVVTILVAIVPLWICGAMVWFSGKYFIQLF